MSSKYVLCYSVICLHVRYFIAKRIQFLIALHVARNETMRFLKFGQTSTILKMFRMFQILSGAQVFAR